MIPLMLVLVAILVFGASVNRPGVTAPIEPVTHDGLPKRGPVLCDGHYVWFQEEIDGVWKIVRVAVTGGEVIRVDVPLADVHLSDIASDGSTLLLSARDGGELKSWAWPTDGIGPRLLPAYGAQAGWAPDRHNVAFGTGSRLTVLSAGHPAIAEMGSAIEGLRTPRWAPDGKYLTFWLRERGSGHESLWLSDRYAKVIRPITTTAESGHHQQNGIWTKSGKYYLYEDGSATRHDLWAAPDPSGFLASRFGRVLRLTDGPLNYTWPAPGAVDGEIFALGESVRGQLVKLDQRTALWRPYLKNGLSAYEVDFSRDGRRAAYTLDADHTLWMSQADGSAPTQLTTSELEAHQPHWSPDGQKIAFMGRRSGGKWRISLVDTVTRVLAEPLPDGPDQGVPSWWNDGRLSSLRGLTLPEIPGVDGHPPPRSIAANGRYTRRIFRPLDAEGLSRRELH